ncbi:MAG: pyridoxamine 5'-phosphate oxidase family protein [Natronomonas sp.]
MEELPEEATDAVLRQMGYGFLGLATGDRPYVIPMSFGYDGTELFFQMNAEGRKYDFIESRTLACFTVFSFEPETGRSRSIIVDGIMEEIPEDETSAAYEALADNANFGTDLDIWGKPLESSTPILFVLRPDEITGRAFGT